MLPLLSLSLALLPALPAAQEGAAAPARPAARSAEEAASSDSERLRRTAEDLAAALAGHDAARALELGARVEPDPRGADPAWWTRFLQSRIQALDSTWTGPLRPLERCLRDALEDRARAEFVLATALPRRRWDPVFHLELAEAALERALAAPPIDRPQAFAAATAVLDDARSTLVLPRAEWIEEALERLPSFRERVLDLAAQNGAPALLEACDAFATLLETSRGEGGEVVPRLGRESWEALVQATTGTRRGTRELRVQLLRELGRLDNAIGEPALRKPASAGALDVAAERARGLGLFARNQVGAASLLPSFDVELEVAIETSASPLAPPERVRRTGDTTRLAFAGPGPAWPAALGEEAPSELEGTRLGAEVIRLGMPGESVLLRLGRAQVTTPPLAWSRGTLEGWGVYALDWLTRHPLVSAAIREKVPGLPAELHRAHLRQVALLLASLEWHALGLSEESVVDGLHLRTGLSVERARLEARRVAHDPLLGIGALGALECVALERTLAREVGPPDPIRFTLSLLLRHPDLRPGDLLRHGLAGGG